MFFCILPHWLDWENVLKKKKKRVCLVLVLLGFFLLGFFFFSLFFFSFFFLAFLTAILSFVFFLKTYIKRRSSNCNCVCLWLHRNRKRRGWEEPQGRRSKCRRHGRPRLRSLTLGKVSFIAAVLVMGSCWRRQTHARTRLHARTQTCCKGECWHVGWKRWTKADVFPSCLFL